MRTTSPDAPVPPQGQLALTTEGLAWTGTVLLFAAIAWLKSFNLVLLLAYLMAGLLVLNGVVAWRHVRRVAAARDPLPPVFAGEAVRTAVRVRNLTARPAVVGVAGAAGTPAGGWLLNPAPPGRETELADPATFPRRGRHRAGNLVVWSGYPFGFLRYERPAADGADVVVLPAVGEADADGLWRWVTGPVVSDQRARHLTRRVTADQAEVRGLRPYRPGDSLRAVHWRSSARRGELLVREYDAAPAPELVLVVEPWLPANPTDAERANLEAALSLAATIVRSWCRHLETRVTVGVPGTPAGAEPVVRTGPPSEAFAREALTPLADVTPGPAFIPLGPGAFGRSLAAAARVLVSSRRNTPFAAALARSAGRPFVALDPAARLPWYRPPRGNPE